MRFRSAATRNGSSRPEPSVLQSASKCFQIFPRGLPRVSQSLQKFPCLSSGNRDAPRPCLANRRPGRISRRSRHAESRCRQSAQAAEWARGRDSQAGAPPPKGRGLGDRDFHDRAATGSDAVLSVETGKRHLHFLAFPFWNRGISRACGGDCGLPRGAAACTPLGPPSAGWDAARCSDARLARPAQSCFPHPIRRPRIEVRRSPGGFPASRRRGRATT
jgi:hypothetical protein